MEIAAETTPLDADSAAEQRRCEPSTLAAAAATHQLTSFSMSRWTCRGKKRRVEGTAKGEAGAEAVRSPAFREAAAGRIAPRRKPSQGRLALAAGYKPVRHQGSKHAPSALSRVFCR